MQSRERIHRSRALQAKESADAWYVKAPSGVVARRRPRVHRLRQRGQSAEFRKEMDILDVWFESGASWHAVLEQEPELRFPCRSLY